MTENLKIAVVGAGIVGATTAYYLKKHLHADVVVFDEATGQATKASAGIISPWLSKRRNKRWYELAKDGAALYPELVTDAGLTTAAYRQNGTIITRSTKEDLTELLTLALTRSMAAPTMGQIRTLLPAEITELVPGATNVKPGVFISGGAEIDGAEFVRELLAATDIDVQEQAVTLTATGQIDGAEHFDKVILAVGAWLPAVLAPLNLDVKVRPQKGQLLELKVPAFSADMQQPVLMPEGERDYIPAGHGKLIMGATHENDMGYDLTVTDEVKKDLFASSVRINPTLRESDITGVRVGTRAYTEDFAPFFGPLPTNTDVLVASGLGSSGLTTGPLIGKLLAEMATGTTIDVAKYTKPIENYIQPE
ncbi:FAD-binding oxidoreductase [Periweissella cryptocerci]|uniref:FAD-binding oxidoreductase n=1 Tax=Periweissella cryptocerci TaxID=2506420 RepID=A0A4P6YWH8_9LACO|nr:FAD-dependent oxidoreductase [Periweissella cryptocerci]QBO37188.1 FAD-binding oxidoreductase [Periweissella cryptocerci]